MVLEHNIIIVYKNRSDERVYNPWYGRSHMHMAYKERHTDTQTNIEMHETSLLYENLNKKNWIDKMYSTYKKNNLYVRFK